ncbi:MAG: UDP-N-acetylglucosamine diphosphorylase [Verrucomicrobiales bacterium]|nr:UDP-N-acetylglucosamine diphosphorylase [Verrucomicrobiales bacterium]MCP5528706.1 UDP-N-acetylglucosamine diphosphorylase [Verrucomicrobiales bacterium]
MFKPTDLFDLDQTAHGALFADCEQAWEALKRIGDYLATHLVPGLHNHCNGVAWIGDRVFIGEGTEVEDGAMIKGPAIIGRNCRIRHNAYIRENVVIGDGCLIGNASEVKNSVLFNECEVPHFNYVGDSILGHKAHLGAGVVISNLRVLPGNVTVELDGKPCDTGLRKFGALLGDHAQIGCNAVLNPGSILGRHAVVYPGVNWRGFLPANMIAKNQAATEVVVRRPRETD